LCEWGKYLLSAMMLSTKKAGSKATGFQFLVYGFSGVRRIGAPAIRRDSGSFFVMRLLLQHDFALFY